MPAIYHPCERARRGQSTGGDIKALTMMDGRDTMLNMQIPVPSIGDFVAFVDDGGDMAPARVTRVWGRRGDDIPPPINLEVGSRAVTSVLHRSRVQGASEEYYLS